MNTNHARLIRAQFAIVLLAISGIISLYLLLDAVKYGETIEFYLGGMAFWEAVWTFAVAVVLLGWNAVTYRAPRYARHGE